MVHFFLLWNPESWALETVKQLKKSGITLTIGMQNPRSTVKDWNPEHESGIRTESKTVLDSLTRGDLYLSSLGLPLPRKDHKKMHS